MVFSNILLVVLTLLSTSIATSPSGLYHSLQDYINDLPPCINNCWAHTWSYAAAACPGGNITCVCLIPDPDTTDPILAKEFEGIDNCTVACPAADQQQFEDAQTKFDDTCQPYYSKYGVPTSASASYYMSILSTATATVTYVKTSSAIATMSYHGGNSTRVISVSSTITKPTVLATSGLNTTTSTAGPVVTAASHTGNLTSTRAATAVGTGTRTSTTSVAVATTNAGAGNSMDWEMSIGLPVLISFVLGVGAQFF